MQHKKRLRQFYGNLAWIDWLANQGTRALHWRLGEATLSPPNAIDASGNGNTGTYANPTKMTPGVTGLGSDSDTCVSWDSEVAPVPYVAIADGGDDLFSLSACSFEIITNDLPEDASNRGIVSKNATSGIAILRFGAGFRVYIGGTSHYGHTNPMSTADWATRHHWLVVYDGTFTDADPPTQNAGRLKIYQNGALETLTFGGSTVIPASFPGAAQNVYLGLVPAATDFLGQLDEFIIWDEAMTAAYALESYTKALP